MAVSRLNPLEIDITNKEHAELLIKEIEGWQNVERKKRAFRANQILTDNQKYFVQDEIRNKYPNSWQKFRLSDINFAAKVINKVAKAYKSEPIRTLENEIESEYYSLILKEGEFKRTLKEADAIFNYYKFITVWIKFIEYENQEGGYYCGHALKPYEYDLIRDPRNGKPLIFIMNIPDSSITQFVGTNDQQEQTITENQADQAAETVKYAVWSRTQHVVVEKKTFYVRDMKGNLETRVEFQVLSVNKDNVNPSAPLLPIAFLSQDTSPDYPTENNLPTQSIDLNVGLTNLLTAADSQGHGQLVYKHPQGQNIKDLHMGMHTAIDLPQAKETQGERETTVEYINAEPDLAGQLEILKFQATQILDDHNVKSKGSLDGSADKFASGFDRLLSNADCIEVIEDNQSLYAESLEVQIYKIIKSASEMVGDFTFQSEEITINFPKPKVLISDKETIENIKLQEEIGLILPWEKHIKMNPNLTEDEAKKRQEEIGKIQDENAQKEIAQQKELMGNNPMIA